MAETPGKADFSQLFAASEQALFAFILSLVPHRADADDIMQETLGRLWQHFDEYDSTRPFQPWAFKFAYMEVQNHRQKARTKRRYFRETVLESLAESYPAEEDWPDLQRRALRHCLKTLNMNERQLLDARYAGGATVAALAAGMGREVNALYKQLQRIRSRLMDCVTAFVGQEA